MAVDAVLAVSDIENHTVDLKDIKVSICTYNVLSYLVIVLF